MNHVGANADDHDDECDEIPEPPPSKDELLAFYNNHRQRKQDGKFNNRNTSSTHFNGTCKWCGAYGQMGKDCKKKDAEMDELRKQQGKGGNKGGWGGKDAGKGGKADGG